MAKVQIYEYAVCSFINNFFLLGPRNEVNSWLIQSRNSSSAMPGGALEERSPLRNCWAATKNRKTKKQPRKQAGRRQAETKDRSNEYYKMQCNKCKKIQVVVIILVQKKCYTCVVVSSFEEKSCYESRFLTVKKGDLCRKSAKILGVVIIAKAICSL